MGLPSGGSRREAVSWGPAPPDRRSPLLSYRHAFHAGNFADVLKHAVLALLVAALARKEKPFAVLDTHAGAGLYDLGSREARKLREWRDGIGRLRDHGEAPAELRPYLEAVEAANTGDGMDAVGRYPGSPLVIRHLLRPGDRLLLCELHRADHAALEALFAGDRQVAVHNRDGYEALKALLPPPERRGLVLIDPAYEVGDEWERVAEGLATAWRRWPTGVLAAWYPLLAGDPHARLERAVVAAGLTKILRVKLGVFPQDSPGGMNGAGMLIVNPPWQVDKQVARLLPWLLARLAPGGQGQQKVDWLVPE